MKRLLLTLSLVFALLVPGTVMAGPFPPVRTVVGTWAFYANFPGVPVPVYIGTATFKPNGSLSGLPLDQHTGATVGEWTRTGPRDFAFTFVADTFDSEGKYANTHRVRGTITVDDYGLGASGKAMLEILDQSGQVIVTAPQNTFVGTRIVVLPLPN
jgi:hypothetical protein